MDAVTKWLVWAHDPCPEGGWHVRGEFPTLEAAVAAAKALHAEEVRDHDEMVAYCKAERPDQPWTLASGCYDGCMVTPGGVFELKVEAGS